MQIIDTHVHYNMEPLFENWPSHWQKAQAHGVKKSIVVGTTLETSQRAVDIARQDENLYAAVGFHPNYTTQEINSLITLLSEKKVITVGETGLDYFRLSDSPSRTKQIKVQQQAFRAHLELARTHRKCVIIHVRDQEMPETPTAGNAYWDALAILKEYVDESRPDHVDTPTHASLVDQLYSNAEQLIEKYSSGTPATHLDFILHCVSGPLAYIDQAIALGGYIGVAGNVTYKSAEHIRTIVTRVPAHKLLLETDAPFLPPVPYRGQSCEPWMISQTAEMLARHTNFNVNL